MQFILLTLIIFTITILPVLILLRLLSKNGKISKDKEKEINYIWIGGIIISLSVFVILGEDPTAWILASILYTLYIQRIKFKMKKEKK